MEASLQELNQKIDNLAMQVAYLTEQAQYTERQRLERAELVRDITPLANQAFSLAIEQLEEIQENIDLNDLLRLFKRLLRNGHNLEKMLDHLESLADLMQTIGPLANDAFGKAVDITADLEAKGYFTFTRGGKKLMDSLMASYNEEELTRLAENIQLVTSMIKEISQPDVLNFANRAVAETRKELEKPVDGSYMDLLRHMRDPAARRGLVITLRILKVIGSKPSKEIEDTNKVQIQAPSRQLDKDIYEKEK